jgi:enamine deaminase RidA (YjgF/YER057c/UK114 family)
MSDVNPALPEPSLPGGHYVPVVVHDGIAYVSGQLPRLNGTIQFVGKVGAGIDLASACEATRLCAMQCLAALEQELGSLERIARLLKVNAYVASAPGFSQQPTVADAASHYFTEVLGARGQHARAAIGVAELPHGAAVELELTAAIR